MSKLLITDSIEIYRDVPMYIVLIVWYFLDIAHL